MKNCLVFLSLFLCHFLSPFKLGHCTGYLQITNRTHLFFNWIRSWRENLHNHLSFIKQPTNSCHPQLQWLDRSMTGIKHLNQTPLLVHSSLSCLSNSFLSSQSFTSTELEKSDIRILELTFQVTQHTEWQRFHNVGFKTVNAEDAMSNLPKQIYDTVFVSFFWGIYRYNSACLNRQQKQRHNYA